MNLHPDEAQRDTIQWSNTAVVSDDRFLCALVCVCMCQVQMVVDWLDWVGLRYAINSTSRSIVDGECQNRLLA